MDLPQRTIGVTGASGMLGAYLCRALLASGARVRGIVRNPAKAKFLEREGVELAQADLLDRPALTEAFRGCDALISNAALYRMLNQRWEDNYRANVLGTENVYEASASAGVGRVVQISTFGVYRWHLGKPAFTEQSPLISGSRWQGGAYRASKRVSEALAFELSEKHGIATTALRPAGIYGARDENLMPSLRRWLSLPVALVPKFGFPFVYAGDIADAAVGALRNDASAGQAYLTAGHNATLYDLARAYKEAAGSSVRLLPIPTFGLGIVVDCSKAEREIGFKNTPFVEGLRATLAADAAEREARPEPPAAVQDTAA